MFEDYESDVLKVYQEKKSKGELVSNLMHPTPGNLRNECVIALDRGPQKKDEILLRSFFQLKDDPDTHRAVIKRWDRDKFRTLNLVLNNRSIKTAEQNIELLAWLIGFEPRPYAFWLKTGVGAKEAVAMIEEEEKGYTKVGDTRNKESLSEPKSDLIEIYRKPFFLRSWVRVASVLLMVSVIGSIIWVNWPPVPGLQKCMFWNGDRYESIACDKRPADTTVMVIGLDSNKLNHFKRITRADTLTAFSIGRVWYIKINGGMEFYTAPGEYPLDPKRRLLPLTGHILDAYPRNPG